LAVGATLGATGSGPEQRAAGCPAGR
jgi:hypothetical protein